MAKFRARARTLDMLGRQQIAGIPTALHELFKNAYDAYATQIDVDYFRARSILLLRDDGTGMSREEFEGRWLTLATESKIDINRDGTPAPRQNMRQRPVMGEKGIGRLAIATIGPIVLVLTRKEGEASITACLIHWGLFELVGIDLHDIELPVAEVSSAMGLDSALGDQLRGALLGTCEQLIAKTDDPGLTRIISDLTEWNPPLDELTQLGYGPNLHQTPGLHFLIHPVRDELAADIDNREKDSATNLERMLLGFADTLSPDAEALLETHFRDHLPDGQVINRISEREFFTPEEYKIADHRVEGRFDEFGNFSGTISIYGSEPRVIKIPLFTNRQFRACGPFSLRFAYVQGQKRDTKIPFEEHAALTGKLDRIGGLYLYKNGIRVLPYGNSDYDFLEIERRRTFSAAYYFFSYRRMFGAIHTDAKQNAGLQEKAGREGFQSNKAYRDFREQLMRFFEELAARFFREDGAYAQEWALERKGLQREFKRLQRRKKSVREAQRELGTDIERAKRTVESGAYLSDLEALNSKAQSRVFSLLDAASLSDVAREIIEVERETKTEIDRLFQTFVIRQPRGVGLTKSLARQLEIYSNLFETQVKPEFKALERRIADTIGGIAADAKVHLDARMRLEASLGAAEERTRTGLTTEQASTRAAMKGVESYVSEQLSSARALVQDTKDELDQALADFDFENADGDALVDLRLVLEDRLIGARQSLALKLEAIRSQLDRVRDVDSEDAVSVDLTISALETELEVMREDYGQSLELAQLGMAVGIVQHEFASSVRSVRRSLKAMSRWAAKNEVLQEIYTDIRDGFDHLDNYLSLFTPLDRRLRRRKTKITGAVIEEFLRELFSDRFERHKVQLVVTKEALGCGLESYTSVVLPVFVNLVDNAIHWLSKKDGARILRLDADGDYFVVEDTGPGISALDQEYIFEFGYSKKSGGQGMGLYIAKTSLNKNDLDIWYDRSYRSGTRFRIGPKDQP